MLLLVAAAVIAAAVAAPIAAAVAVGVVRTLSYWHNLWSTATREAPNIILVAKRQNTDLVRASRRCRARVCS